MAHLENVLGQGVVHHVDISGLAEAPQEVDGDGPAQGEVQTLEDPPLHGQQLPRGVRVVCDIDEVFHLRGVDLFVLNIYRNTAQPTRAGE